MNNNIAGTFVKRLKKIGIDVTLAGNYPWIYLESVCGNKVWERYEANHGFTAFWLPVNKDRPIRISDSKVVFSKIRQMLTEEGRKLDIEEYNKFMEDYIS